MKATKRYFLIVDTETTVRMLGQSYVYDFGAILCDKQGNVVDSISCVLKEYKHLELFHDNTPNGFFSKKRLADRHDFYDSAIANNEIKLLSIKQVNAWLNQVNQNYDNVTLTAYNLPFDLNGCSTSGINIEQFTTRLCLWGLSCKLIANRSSYIKWTIKHRMLSPKAIIKTSAEAIYSYITSNAKFREEHTAFQDCKIEKEILLFLIKQKQSMKVYAPYNWRNFCLPAMIEKGFKISLA